VTDAWGAEEEWLPFLSSDRVTAAPDSAQGRDASYLEPWGSVALRPGAGFVLEARAAGGFSSEPVVTQLGIPELSGRGSFAWSGSLFHGDMALRFAWRASARSKVGTPYGTLRELFWSDAEALARVGRVQFFWVLANATNVNERSFAFDGSFQPLPRRHYRAGLRWTFLD
jgi:hypothetical protein